MARVAPRLPQASSPPSSSPSSSGRRKRPRTALAIVGLGSVWCLFLAHFSRAGRQDQLIDGQQRPLPQDLAARLEVEQPPISGRILKDDDGSLPHPVTYKDFDHDAACVRKGQGQVLLLHMRKAGGSSLRQVISEMDRDWARAEGRTFNVSCFDEGPRVFVTSLRDPVDRILSSYEYEGRQRRFDFRMYHDDAEEAAVLARWEQHRNGTLGKANPTVLPGPPVSLRDWVHQTRRDYYSRETAAYRRHNAWLSVENYYIKTLTNRHRADPAKPVTRADLALAKRILANTDMVLIMEWFDDPDQAAYVASRLGLGEGFRFPRKQVTQGRRAARRRPAEAGDDEAMELLRSLNALDTELYEFAKSLARSRIDQELAAVRSGRRGHKEGEDKDKGRPCGVPPESIRLQYGYEKWVKVTPACMYPLDGDPERKEGGARFVRRRRGKEDGRRWRLVLKKLDSKQ